MKAVKENKVYTIGTEQEAENYYLRGFDILNDDGSVKRYGAGKTVPYEKYAQLLEENAALKEKKEKRDTK